MNIVIAGTRTFNNYELLSNIVDLCLNDYEGKLTILSGHCQGTDELGELYAKEHNYNLELYPADWEHLGKKAGPIRNKEMINKADMLIAFWDNKSRGTKNIIDLAFKKGIRVLLCNYGKGEYIRYEGH